MRVRVNPVLEKEAKTKMRGWRAPALLSIYLLFLAGLVLLYFIAQNLNRYYAGFDPRTALNAYTLLAMFQLGLLLFIVPALTSSAISGERERQTLDLLLCTRLSALSIIIGKLTASVSHVILLIVATVPVFSIVFLYGGLSPMDVAVIFLFYIVTTLLVGSLGIFFSALFKKTTVATIVTYVVVLGLTIGTFLGHEFYRRVVAGVLRRQPELWESLTILCTNPFFGLGSILENQTGHFYFVRDILRLRGSNVSGFNEHLPWLLNISFDIVVSVILLLISTWIIKPVKKMKRK